MCQRVDLEGYFGFHHRDDLKNCYPQRPYPRESSPKRTVSALGPDVSSQGKALSLASEREYSPTKEPSHAHPKEFGPGIYILIGTYD